MPLPTISDTIRAAVRGLAPNGHTWENVIHFRKSGALTYPGAIVILDALLFPLYNTNLGTGSSWRTHSNTGYSMQDVTYTPLDGTSATTVIAHVASGSDATDALPANVALVATLRTGLRGRSYRGRVYWNGWSEAGNTAAGGPASGAVTNMQAQFNQFLTNLVGSGVNLVVASYRLGLATDVATVTVDARWDTQRRRLRP